MSKIRALSVVFFIVKQGFVNLPPWKKILIYVIVHYKRIPNFLYC
jgi:hypothetical protein